MEFRCVGLCRAEDVAVIERGAHEFTRQTGMEVAFTSCTEAQELFRLAKGHWDAVLVFMPGAIGMEVANGARQSNSTAPLVWISDDEAFAIHSYRLKARAFMMQPVTECEIAEALARCAEG